jgi:hypothetical protein
MLLALLLAGLRSTGALHMPFSDESGIPMCSMFAHVTTRKRLIISLLTLN